MKASLLVLAAGMGSRYGSLKQMDGFGPNGETIIDYSIYDALNAGFDKVVFVVRNSFRDEIEAHFRSRIGDRIKFEFVEQELDKLPEGFTLNPAREKPWGTAHAVMMGAECIDGPFAVINADDYYGPSSYKILMEYFKSLEGRDEFAVVSYYLKNTLSDHGTVNRGVCYSNDKGCLTKIVETLKISKSADGIIRYPQEDQEDGTLAENTLVSMNMFGFTALYFKHANEKFKTFLEERADEPKSELFIPNVLDDMIAEGTVQVRVLTSKDRWFGVTYKEDKPLVMEKLNKLIREGVYPEKLWS